MDFELGPAQEEIVRQVRSLCARFPDEYWRDKDSSHDFPHEFHHAIAEAGYLGIAIPEQYGGSGLGITEASLLMREVAACGGAMNAASAIHLSIFGMTPVIHHGSEELKRRCLPRDCPWPTALFLRGHRARRRQRYHPHQDHGPA